MCVGETEGGGVCVKEHVRLRVCVRECLYFSWVYIIWTSLSSRLFIRALTHLPGISGVDGNTDV